MIRDPPGITLRARHEDRDLRTIGCARPPRGPRSAVNRGRSCLPVAGKRATLGFVSQTMTRADAEQRIERLLSGERLRDVLPGGHSMRLFYAALAADAELQALYDAAQRARSEAMADELVHIADTETDAARARNRISARQWLASKLAPRKYGDKLEVHQTGHIDLTAVLSRVEARMLDSLPHRCPVTASIAEEPLNQPIRTTEAAADSADDEPKAVGSDAVDTNAEPTWEPVRGPP